MSTQPTDPLHKAIIQAMDTETCRIIDEEAKNAAARVEERVRRLTGQIATQVASWTNYDAMRNEVRITVRLPDRDPGTPIIGDTAKILMNTPSPANQGQERPRDWLHVGVIVSHRETSDRWRRRGEIIDTLPFGEFIVKWDRITRPERVLRYDLRDGV